MSKRRKRDTTRLKELLTPVLKKELGVYKAEGRMLSAEAANAFLYQVAGALEQALDGEFDRDKRACCYCDFVQKEKERLELAKQSDRVCCSLPDRHPRRQPWPARPALESRTRNSCARRDRVSMCRACVSAEVAMHPLRACN